MVLFWESGWSNSQNSKKCWSTGICDSSLHSELWMEQPTHLATIKVHTWLGMFTECFLSNNVHSHLFGPVLFTSFHDSKTGKSCNAIKFTNNSKQYLVTVFTSPYTTHKTLK